jgi:hypothetical protein
MEEGRAHARNHDLSAAAEIFANGTYFLNELRKTGRCMNKPLVDAVTEKARRLKYQQ